MVGAGEALLAELSSTERNRTKLEWLEYKHYRLLNSNQRRQGRVHLTLLIILVALLILPYGRA